MLINRIFNFSIIKRCFTNSNFGIAFDIDGVLIRGTQPIKEACQMFDYLSDNKYIDKIPIVYLTNSCDQPKHKAEFLSDLFNHQIRPEQLINAPAPLKIYNHLHDRRTLFVTQDNPSDVADMLNFKYPVSLQELKRAYPTLDVMDKRVRKDLKAGYEEKPVDPVDTIVIVGEPVEWESYLQIITDLLITKGQPASNFPGFTDPERRCEIIICNLDFIYATEYKLPRYGNGAFIYCLESLYEKLTGNRIRFSSVIGKPSEVSFRYAEHVLSSQLAKLPSSCGGSLKRFYMIGDNPSSDILGANLYNQYVKSLSNHNDSTSDLPHYRHIPDNVQLLPQTVSDVKSILVSTGVYKAGQCPIETQQHQHAIYTSRKIDTELTRPNLTVDSCLDAVYRIIEMEKVAESIRK